MKKITLCLALIAIAAAAWAQNAGQVTPPAVRYYKGPSFGDAYAPVSGGVPAADLVLTSFRNNDGTILTASASAGKFGLSYTPGTSQALITEAANSNTKTDTTAVDVVLSSFYQAGSNITITVNCQYTLGSGTVGTHTLAAAAYLIGAAGTEGANLIATSAQTVPASAGNVTFTITGTTLSPGSRLTLTFTGVIQDTGGSNITAQINSVSSS